MTELVAPGLPGNWLNGWLAAIGITVLLPGTRLSWTDDVVPVAVLHYDGDDLVAALADALPGEEELAGLAIARRHPHAASELGRKVDLATFSDRARLARETRDGSLEATITDLALDKDGWMEHGPLDAAVPKGLTLHERLVSVRSGIVGDARDAIARTLAGSGNRCHGNGLGFDHRRFASGVQASADVAVDPVVELACFFGVLLLPVRGSDRGARQRGWNARILRRSAFTWPVWAPSLDRWAIDALLDIVWSTSNVSRLTNIGATGLFGSVAQQPKGSLDSTRGYASERLW